MGQQWYGGTEGVPGTPFCPYQDSGEGKDCETAVVMVGLRGVSGTPFSPLQDSGDGKDCGTAVVWWN